LERITRGYGGTTVYGFETNKLLVLDINGSTTGFYIKNFEKKVLNNFRTAVFSCCEINLNNM
jgi:hypothetical protein